MTTFTPAGEKSPDSSQDAPPENHDQPTGDQPARADGSTNATQQGERRPACCPRCGQRVCRIVVRGPTDAAYQPCGCRAFPGEIHPSLNATKDGSPAGADRHV